MSPSAPASPGPRRVRAPRRLRVPALLEGRGQPALEVLQLDAADLPQPPLADQRPRVLDHRVAAVVVREREHAVPRAHEPAQRLGVRDRRRQRLVAHDVETRLEEGARHIEVKVVRRRDDHEIQPPLRRPRRLRGRHFDVAPVHPRGIQPHLGPLRRGPLGVRREGAGRDPGQPVEFRRHPVHVPDEGARSASDHPVRQAAGHPWSGPRPIFTAR